MASLGFAASPRQGSLVFARYWPARALRWGRPTKSLRSVRFHGFSVRVPRSWSVYDLSRDSRACVRFDRHALYLGSPGRDERCPAQAVGRTEAILISPLTPGRGDPGASAGALQLQGDATSFRVPSAGVEATATWSRAPRLISQALGRKSLPGAIRAAPASGAPRAASNANERPASSSRSASIFTGLGFDTCRAPSTSEMSAWSASPFRAVGIYIGEPTRRAPSRT